jgi:uncharacterized protein YndB with AHSA1/START domain
MNKSAKTIAVKVERTIPAPAAEVFDAWLDPKVRGNPWQMGDKLILNPRVNGLFYWKVHGTPHYGRFTAVKRPARIQHTWMSPYTTGLESTVTVTFKKKGGDTRMTLVHSGLPNTEGGRKHDRGWNYFLDIFPRQFAGTAGKKK